MKNTNCKLVIIDWFCEIILYSIILVDSKIYLAQQRGYPEAINIRGSSYIFLCILNKCLVKE